MKRWEYRCDMLGPCDHATEQEWAEYLNRNGAEGWMLGPLTHGGDKMSVHWRRALRRRFILRAATIDYAAGLATGCALVWAFWGMTQ